MRCVEVVDPDAKLANPAAKVWRIGGVTAVGNNAPVNGDRQREVATAMGQPSKRASEVLDDFIRGLGMPRRLREVNVEEADLPRLAKNCMLDDWTYSNPRPISGPDEVMEILKAAY